MTAIGLLACLGLLWIVSTWIARLRTRYTYGVARGAIVVGFFHPYCSAGGGGERVLWRAIHALAGLGDAKGKRFHVLVYTGDVGKAPEDILDSARRQFQIPLDVAIPIDFVVLRGRSLLDPACYPVMTMMLQSLGSFFVGLEALARATPEVFMDTTGFAFTFSAAFLFSCKIGAYVHYPTISTDMLRRVRDRRPAYNNRGWISSSATVSYAKLLYYRTFAALYGLAGAHAGEVMVNSTWTQRHIAAIWWRSNPVVVFPPCDTADLKRLPINHEGRGRYALSVGQFRPEKEHALQVAALAELRRRGAGFADVRLVIVGSCRGDADRGVLARVQETAAAVGVADGVDFVVNCSFQELRARLGAASVGLHTMWNEHFGIGVVEMMAAGLVTIAHRSGGPLADIVVAGPSGSPPGFLAETPAEYADIMADVFGECPSRDYRAVREAGRESAGRFSDAAFDKGFAESFAHLVWPRTPPATASPSR